MLPYIRAVEIHTRMADFPRRFGRRVKKIGGRYSECRGNYIVRYVTIPISFYGLTRTEFSNRAQLVQDILHDGEGRHNCVLIRFHGIQLDFSGWSARQGKYGRVLDPEKQPSIPHISTMFDEAREFMLRKVTEQPHLIERERFQIREHLVTRRPSAHRLWYWTVKTAKKYQKPTRPGWHTDGKFYARPLKFEEERQG